MDRPPEPVPKTLRITGLPAVSALFERNGRLVERLFFDERNAAAVVGFCRELGKARKPYRQVDAEELARVAGTVLHGGVVARKIRASRRKLRVHPQELPGTAGKSRS